MGSGGGPGAGGEGNGNTAPHALLHFPENVIPLRTRYYVSRKKEYSFTRAITFYEKGNSACHAETFRLPRTIMFFVNGSTASHAVFSFR